MKIVNMMDKIILILLLFSLVVIISRGCEVLNIDTNICETHAEQNLTLNSAWTEFY